MATSKSNTLQTTEKGNTLPASQELTSMFAGDANLGLENLGKQDMSTPFLNVIQALSPQRQRGHEKQIQGAEEGMIFNSVTGELFDGMGEGVLFIPVWYEMVYNVWVDRKKGQGFKGTFQTRAEAEAKAMEDADWVVVDTQNHYVLYFSPQTQSWSGAIISCTSTKLKPSRDFNTKLTQLRLQGPSGPFTPPRFSTVWRLKTVSAKKDQHTFFNIQIVSPDPEKPVVYVPDAQVYKSAQKFYAQSSGGEVKVDYNQAEDAPVVDVIDQLDADDGEPKF